MGIVQSTCLYVHRRHGGKCFDHLGDDQSFPWDNEAAKPIREIR